MEKINKNSTQTLEIFCADTISVQDISWSEVFRVFVEETIQSLCNLGIILRGIHRRLVADGYIIRGE